MLDKAFTAAQGNGLSKLTLWKVGSAWQANAMFNDSGGWRVVTHDSIIEALKAVCELTVSEKIADHGHDLSENENGVFE